MRRVGGVALVTHYKTLIETDWLGQWDLPIGRDVIVRIASVDRYVPEKKKKDEKTKRIAIGFAGKRKRWLAGPVSQKALAKMYGPNVEQWIGQLVALYVDESVRFGSETTGGIRVRPTIPRGKETTEALDATPPQEKVEQLERAQAAALDDEPAARPVHRQPGED